MSFKIIKSLSESEPLVESEKRVHVDGIKMDVPLFIRALEYAREDASGDKELHDFSERAEALMKSKDILTMEDYGYLVSGKSKKKEPKIAGSQDNVKKEEPKKELPKKEEPKDKPKVAESLEELEEGKVDIEVMMTIEQVIRDGRISNGAQRTVIAKIVELLRSGGLYKTANFNEGYPTADTVNSLKSLTTEEVRCLAINIKGILENKFVDLGGYYNPTLNIVDYIKFVTQREDD